MPRVPLAIVGGVLGLALLAGCETVEDVMGERDDDNDDDGPRTVAFNCDDDRDLRVRLSESRDEALVDTGDETYQLERTGRDGDLRVYTNDDGVRLDITNQEAEMRIPGEENFRDCERS
jgi:hypothetical protein